LVGSGLGKVAGKEGRRMNMYVNTKMIPVETVPGMGKGIRRRAVEGLNSSMVYLIQCKNLCKCHNKFPPTTTKKEKKQERIDYWLMVSMNYVQ
jgi:hypothetical protein